MSPSDLSEYFRNQARWRESKAAEYPEDHRNAQSSAALYSLATHVESQAADGPHAAIDALEPHLFEAVALGGEATRRAVVRYGYGYAVATSQHEEFLAELGALCLEDAYEYVGDAGDGEDPTGTLFWFEADAAKDGVHLGRQYWARRPNAVAAELEAAVASYRVPAA